VITTLMTAPILERLIGSKIRAGGERTIA